jgi:hypothetical protein
MYIVCWREIDRQPYNLIVSEINPLASILRILDESDNVIEYIVSAQYGVVSNETFNLGDYKKWVVEFIFEEE